MNPLDLEWHMKDANWISLTTIDCWFNYKCEREYKVALELVYSSDLLQAQV